MSELSSLIKQDLDEYLEYTYYIKLMYKDNNVVRKTTFANEIRNKDYHEKDHMLKQRKYKTATTKRWNFFFMSGKDKRSVIWKQNL